MATKHDLADWTVQALRSMGGRARLVDVCKHIWQHHEARLRESGDLFYTWQYDVRWAADELRRTKKMKPATVSPRGIWELN